VKSQALVITPKLVLQLLALASLQQSTLLDRSMPPDRSLPVIDQKSKSRKNSPKVEKFRFLNA
jgi:hypothetical protein